MIRDHGTGIRLIAAENHVTARLTPENKTCVFQMPRARHGLKDQLAVWTCKTPAWLCGIDFHKFHSCLGRNMITGLAAILDIYFNRLTDVGHGF